MRTPRIIEQEVRSRSSDPALCEDRIVVCADFLAVIDGATSKYAFPGGEHPPGVIVADLLAAALHEMPRAAKCDEAIDFICDVLQRELSKAPYSLGEAAAASIVIFSCFRREVWRVGDCLFRIGNRMYASRNGLEGHIAAVRAAYNQIQLLSGTKIDELRKCDLGRQLVEPLLRLQYTLMNSTVESPFAFGAINGKRVPPRFRERVVLPKKLSQLILASDGYPKVLGTLEESEKYLMEVLEQDPLCIRKHVATKGLGVGQHSFDDRAYLRVEV